MVGGEEHLHRDPAEVVGARARRRARRGRTARPGSASNSRRTPRRSRASWKTTTWLRLRWQSVTVKLAEPDSRAEVGRGLAAVVADDELLVEDRRVVVGLDVDVAAQQGGEDAAVGLQARCRRLGSTAPGAGRSASSSPARGSELGQLRGSAGSPARGTCGRSPRGSGRRGCAWAIGSESSSWTAMSSDCLAPAMKSTITCSRSSAAPELGRPDEGLDLAAGEGRHSI